MLECQLVHELERCTDKDRRLAARLQPATSTQFVELSAAGGVCQNTSGDAGMSGKLIKKGSEAGAQTPPLLRASSPLKPKNLTQNPKTGPKETRVILGRAVLERRRDDAEESSQRRTDRDRVAARRNGREGGGYLPEGGDQRGDLLRVEEALCRVGD